MQVLKQPQVKRTTEELRAALATHFAAARKTPADKISSSR
jgi:hypothetical protein